MTIIDELDNIVADKVSYIEITQDQYNRFKEALKLPNQGENYYQELCFRGIGLKVK